MNIDHCRLVIDSYNKFKTFVTYITHDRSIIEMTTNDRRMTFEVQRVPAFHHQTRCVLLPSLT